MCLSTQQKQKTMMIDLYDFSRFFFFFFKKLYEINSPFYIYLELSPINRTKNRNNIEKISLKKKTANKKKRQNYNIKTMTKVLFDIGKQK